MLIQSPTCRNMRWELRPPANCVPVPLHNADARSNREAPQLRASSQQGAHCSSRALKGSSTTWADCQDSTTRVGRAQLAVQRPCSQRGVGGRDCEPWRHALMLRCGKEKSRVGGRE